MINVRVRNASWERGHEAAELDLLLLLGYKLQRNWNGRVRLLTVVPTIDVDRMRRVVARTRSASLFVRGSGDENALG